MSTDSKKQDNPTDAKPPVIRRRHRWDNPKDKLSATCINCGCRRYAERFGSGMSWVYVQKGKYVEVTAVPACL